MITIINISIINTVITNIKVSFFSVFEVRLLEPTNLECTSEWLERNYKWKESYPLISQNYKTKTLSNHSLVHSKLVGSKSLIFFSI